MVASTSPKSFTLKVVMSIQCLEFQGSILIRIVITLTLPTHTLSLHEMDEHSVKAVVRLTGAVESQVGVEWECWWIWTKERFRSQWTAYPRE